MSTSTASEIVVTTPAEFYDKWLAPCDIATRKRRRELVALAIEHEPDSESNEWRRGLIAHIDAQIDPLSVGTVVAGAFFSDGTAGIGVIVEGHTLGRAPLDTRRYAAVKIVHGDRCDGGYNRAKLTALPNLKVA